MIVTAKEKRPPVQFVPFTLTIEVETYEEACAVRALWFGMHSGIAHQIANGAMVRKVDTEAISKVARFIGVAADKAITLGENNAHV